MILLDPTELLFLDGTKTDRLANRLVFRFFEKSSGR